MILHNTFRDKINEGKGTIGTHILFHDPDIPEMVGDTGLFDYAEYVGEYSTFDMTTLYHIARSAQCGNLPLMFKLDQEGQGFWAQAALGAGFKSILFTDVRTADDVDECHRLICCDTPDVGGHMGVKLRRPALSSYDIDGYMQDLKSVVFAIMIEKQATLDSIDAVLERAKAKGVDMTQWGPADFAFSTGDPSIQGTPKIREYEEIVIKKSIEYDVPPRIEIGEVEQAKRYIDMGVKHFCIGWDRFIYRQKVAQLGEGMQKLLETV